MREPFGKLDKGKTYIPALGACVGKSKAPPYVRVAKLVRLQTDNLEIRGSESHPLHQRERKARTFLLGSTESYIFPPGVDVYDCNT